MVLGQSRSDHVGACVHGELDEEAADSPCRPDDEHRLARLGRERIECGERRDRRERRGAGVLEVQPARLRCSGVVLRDGDQLRPAPSVDGRVRMDEETEDLVAGPIAADRGADLLDDAGEVAAEDDRKLVLGHLLQRTRGDEDVDGIDRGGADAHHELVRSGDRRREVVSNRRPAVEAVEGKGSHIGLGQLDPVAIRSDEAPTGSDPVRTAS